MTMAWDILSRLADSQSWQGFALDLLLKSSLLLSAAGAFVLILRRRSAATRHGLWLLAFAGLVLLPIFSLALPTWRISVAAPVSAPPVTALLFSGRTESNLAPAPVDRQSLLEKEATGAGRPLDESSASQKASSISMADLAWTWRWRLAAGCLVALTPLLLGSLSLRWLRRGAISLNGSRVEDLVQNLARISEISRRVSVLSSEHCSMPMTWGVDGPLCSCRRQPWTGPCRVCVRFSSMSWLM